jgi:Cys-tRNA(Pro)/Cys-tRNA(Cys) deacylase
VTQQTKQSSRRAELRPTSVRDVAKKTSVGTPATVALTKAGVPFALHTYDHDRSTGSYGLEAAEALGLDAATVFKTLLADVDGSLVVAVVPVSGQLDLKALAAAVGGKRATMADPALAERTTGYVVGGISPIGQKKPLRTVIDTTALRHETIYVSAGRRGADLGLAPADLVTITRGVTADIRAEAAPRSR